MIRRAAKIVAINLLVLLGLVVLLEGVGQLVALLRPSYDVLFMQPDRVVGWKQVPDLRFTWTGYDWYAAEFSVDVQTNSHGFRDRERVHAHPENTSRVAILGDSFIEAVQVPLPKTAAQVLEARLNAGPQTGGDNRHQWEVLNFGVSNHGVGQYLLMWEAYAGAYRPDYVAVFVAKFHMRRTVSKYEFRAFTATRDERLWVRPTFRMEDGVPIREPARDFEEFQRAQEELTRSEFAGSRIRKKPPQLITLHYARLLRDEVTKLVKHVREGPPPPKVVSDAEREMVALNLRLIDDLGRSVESAGARMIVVDASQYFEEDPALAKALRELCVRRGFGYVPAYENLLQANANGVATRWRNDTHFNESGNAILASALYDWIAQNERSERANGSR